MICHNLLRSVTENSPVRAGLRKRVTVSKGDLGKAVTVAALVMSACLVGLPQTANSVNVLTQHNDNSRTGANLNEKVLSTSSVNPTHFGKLFARTVDGEIYAQPLYVSSIYIPDSGFQNVVFVCTMHNTVYAFNADDPDASSPLWQVNLGPAVPAGDVQPCCPDISKEIGILSTPVIDVATKTMYVVARTKADSDDYHQWLHALDLTTGHDKFPPNEIVLDGFDPKIENQRTALTLSGGVVYVAWASHNDAGPYHGWVMGFDAGTLGLVSEWNATRTGEMGGIWQSGGGLCVDPDGSIYVITGNGDYDGVSNFGNSFVKLRPGSNLTVSDWFTPHNYAELNEVDNDLGSANPLLIPGTGLIVGGGKEGVFYVIDRHNMGRFNDSGDMQIVQSWKAYGGHLHGAPVYWHGPSEELVYLWSEDDVLKAFRLTNGEFQPNPAHRGVMAVPPGMPGGILSISADGSREGSGVVWATHPLFGDANKSTVYGIVRAFDASDIARELWNSEQYSDDTLGYLAKFCPPTVANGKVYIATFSNQLVVYGLLPQPRPPLGDSKPEILSVDMPDGKVARAYTASLVARGADPMVWSLSSGNLPPGLVLDPTGAITGVPTLAGEFDFEVRVFDRFDQWAVAGLQITIEPGESVAVTQPAAGDVWTVKQKQEIKWSATPGIRTVTVSISRDGGGTWTNLEENINTAPGSLMWKVTKPRSNSVVIRVADSANGEVLGKSGVFRID